MGHSDENADGPRKRRGRTRGRVDHLERHGAGWRVRVRRPKALVVGNLPDDLRITIGAAPYAAAARAARAVRAAADRLFAEVSGMNEEQIERRLAAWRKEMNLTVAANLVGTGRMFVTPTECAVMDAGMGPESGGDVEPSQELDQLFRVVAAGPWAEDLVRRALAGFSAAREELAPIREAGLRALGFETPEAQAGASALIPHVYKTWLQSLREQALFGAGDPDALAAALGPTLAPIPAQACAVGRSVEGVAETAELADVPRSLTSKPDDEEAQTAPPSDDALVIADAGIAQRPLLARWDEFVKEKIDVTRKWKDSRRPELKSTRRVFERMCGEVPSACLTRTLIKAWREDYLALPHDYREHPKFADMSVADLVAWSKARERNKLQNAEAREGYVRVNAGSFNKHLSSLNAYVAWLIAEGDLPKEALEAFGEIHVPKPKGKSSSSERLRYRDEQVRLLFSSPVFLGRKHERFLLKPGPLVIRDSLYWAPLISAFHGMRREEICQLRVRHVRQEYGIWYFDLNEPNLSLKVENVEEDEGSRRRIPLHRRFLELGFVEDKVIGRPPHALLFDELDADNAHAAYGEKFGKRFGLYVRGCGIVEKGEEAGLHRLRHLFCTILVNTVENVAFVDALMGHTGDERKSERKRYTDELFLKKLKQTIDRLVLPIDVAALKAAAERSAAFQREEAERAAGRRGRR